MTTCDECEVYRRQLQSADQKIRRIAVRRCESCDRQKRSVAMLLKGERNNGRQSARNVAHGD
jgi:hypothetical protein